MRKHLRPLLGRGTAEDLAALRIGLCLILVLRLSRGIYLELAGQPEALFRPRSFMLLLDRMPPRSVTLAIQITGIFLAICALLGIKGRWSLAGAWLCGVFLGGMHNSIGKVMHNEVLLLLAMVPLLLARHSDAWALGKGPIARDPRIYAWPLAAARITVVGAYFFAGYAKLKTSGLAWAFSDNMRWVLLAASDSQSSPNEAALWVASIPALSIAMAAGMMFFELSFPLALADSRLAAFYAAGAVVLHAGTYLLIGLDYTAWIGTVLVVLLDRPERFKRTAGSLDGRVVATTAR